MTQECLNVTYLTIKVLSKIKFFHDHNEQDKMTQTVQEIVEIFNSE